MTPPMSLAERRHVSFSPDAGLSSVEGARAVIAAISSRRVVSKLTISHNRLGEEGFKEMFNFLCSSDGRKYQIDEMDLHNCGMGSDALGALSVYIESNVSLEIVHLQQNDFGEDLDSVACFAEAINRSRIRLLTLSSLTCPTAQESIIHFLQRLDNPFLHELILSYNSLTSASAPTIASFLTSPRCHLRTLKLSANKLGYSGICAIISAMEHNYSLRSLEFFSNNTKEDDDAVDQAMWKELTRRKTALQGRNEVRQKTVEQEAMQLLRHSRILLLGHTDSVPEISGTRSSLPIPMELQLHTLSFFAPTLTDAQRVRIYKYASERSTLPRLLPSLAPHACLRDPASLPFGFSSSGSSGTGCSNGQCMGSATSLNCRRESERLAWLTEVGCDIYIPGRREE